MESKPESLEKGGSLQISKEKLQDLRAKFDLMKKVSSGTQEQSNSQSQPYSFNKPISSVQSSPPNIQPINITSSIVNTKVYSKATVEETQFHNRKMVSEPNIDKETTKIRFTITREPTILEKSASEPPPIIGNSSKIIMAKELEISEIASESKSCFQTLPILFDRSQNILEKFLYEMRLICPDLDFPHYFHKALQCLQMECKKVSESGDSIYKILFDILQHKIYVMVLFNNQGIQWSNLNISEENIKNLEKQPCKVFYFLLRLLALFLYAINHKLNKDQRVLMSLKILQILENISQFIKKGQQTCSLKAMFAFARHNPLSQNFSCYAYTEGENAPSYREDIFSVNSSELVPKSSESIENSSAKIQSLQKSAAIFYGELAYIGIYQVFQILNMQRKTGCLIVQGTDTIKIYLDQGVVIHSEVGEVTGEEAFYLVLAQEKGRFNFILESPPQITMNHPIEFLLMEGSRRLDEQKRGENT